MNDFLPVANIVNMVAIYNLVIKELEEIHADKENTKAAKFFDKGQEKLTKAGNSVLHMSSIFLLFLNLNIVDTEISRRLGIEGGGEEAAKAAELALTNIPAWTKSSAGAHGLRHRSGALDERKVWREARARSKAARESAADRMAKNTQLGERIVPATTPPSLLRSRLFRRPTRRARVGAVVADEATIPPSLSRSRVLPAAARERAARRASSVKNRLPIAMNAYLGGFSRNQFRKLSKKKRKKQLQNNRSSKRIKKLLKSKTYRKRKPKTYKKRKPKTYRK